jgi:hypothetical protein
MESDQQMGIGAVAFPAEVTAAWSPEILLRKKALNALAIAYSNKSKWEATQSLTPNY